jgi:hypothetical protein
MSASTRLRFCPPQLHRCINVPARFAQMRSFHNQPLADFLIVSTAIQPTGKGVVSNAARPAGSAYLVIISLPRDQ